MIGSLPHDGGSKVTDTALTLAADVGVFVALVVLASLFARKPIHLPWLIGAVVVFAIYTTALMYGGKLFTLDALQPIAQYLPKSGWNWRGKIVSILSTLVMTGVVALILKDTWTRAGFTLRQSPGSVPRALIAAILLIAISYTLEYLAHDGTDTSAPTLLYQAVAPGLDEEPMFRGLLLLVLAQAFAADQARILCFGWAGVISSFIFGAVHGLGFQGGEFFFAPMPMVYAGATGVGLLYIRERTGSLLLPILTHNAINVALCFF